MSATSRPEVDTGTADGLFGLPARPPGRFAAAVAEAQWPAGAPTVLRLVADLLADRLDEMADTRRYRGLVPLAAELRILLATVGKDYADAPAPDQPDAIAALMAEFEAAEARAEVVDAEVAELTD